MVIFLILLALVCLYGMKFSFKKEGFADYMSPAKTGSIKGIFVFIVLFSHVRQYITLDSGVMNEPFLWFMRNMGQLMVVAFLFYSGYGVALGLKNKDGYVKTLPTKRALKVFIHFDVAILLFWITGIALGKNYPVKTVLLSLIGLSGIGNSTWFIFDIIILYLLNYAVFIFTKKRMVIGTAILTVLSVAAVYIISLWKGYENYWWYDTLLCFPLGMWYALAKPYIDKALLNSPVKWLITTVVAAIAFALLHQYPIRGTRLVFIAEALVFAILMVLLSMRISVNNGILQWFGKRVFGIYILQRIPMMILAYFGANENPFLFAAASFAITIIFAEVFERAMDKLDIALKLSKKKA